MASLDEDPLQIAFKPSIYYTSTMWPSQCDKFPPSDLAEKQQCRYTISVYKCCGTPYSLTTPPPITHLPSRFIYANLAGNPEYPNQGPTCHHTSPSTICSTLCSEPLVETVDELCPYCIFVQAASDDGMDDDRLVRGEWVLAFWWDPRSEDEKDDELYVEGKIKWVRIEAPEGWRSMGRGEGEGEEMMKVVVEIEGEEWTVVR